LGVKGLKPFLAEEGGQRQIILLYKKWYSSTNLLYSRPNKGVSIPKNNIIIIRGISHVINPGRIHIAKNSRRVL
jgi:hypothetical protein